jgi:hypothetical protein
MEHPHEDIYRLKQLYQLYIADNYLAKKTAHNFVWKNSAVQYNANCFKKYVSSSDDLRSFSFYTLTINDITKIENWRKDFKNNITSPVMHIRKINNQNFKKFGDIRYVATVSRLHHIPMILAAGLAGNIKNAEDLVSKQLSDWKEQNPFLQSINWKNGIEAGIRIVNLIYARKLLLLYNNKSSEKSIEIIDELAFCHFHFLIKHLSLYSSANNHLLFELMGVFIISCNYSFSSADLWKQKSLKHLMDELFKQTFEDGFTKEQSSHYHAEVTNIYAVVFAEMQKNKIKIPEASLTRFEKMGEALFYLLNDEDELMAIGDSDEGQILYPYFRKHFSLKHSLLNDVLILTGKNFYEETKIPELDLRNYIIWEKEFSNLYGQKQSYHAIQHKFFKSSGYLFLSFSPVKVLFDAGNIGLGKLAAHGHADALQILLSINKEPFLIDPGTYQYHSRLDNWRNYFRGTLAHNTISVNGASQAKSGGRMIWNVKPQIVINHFDDDENIITCSASHNGFVKQQLKVVHKRKVTYFKKEWKLMIEDDLSGDTDFTIYFSVHFAPHLKIVHNNGIVNLTGNSASLVLKNKLFKSAQLLKADDNYKGGWYSPAFDELKPTTTLRLKIDVNKKINLVTEATILFSKNGN